MLLLIQSRLQESEVGSNISNLPAQNCYFKLVLSSIFGVLDFCHRIYQYPPPIMAIPRSMRIPTRMNESRFARSIATTFRSVIENSPSAQ